MSKKKIIVIVGLILFILIAGGLTWYIFNGGSDSGDSSESSSSKTDKPQAASSKDIASFIASQANLSKYNKLLITTGQSETLKSTSVGYIVLAPVNDAYKSLPNGYYDSLLTEAKKASAIDITKYSIVIATNDQLTTGQKLKTTNGQEVIVEIADGKYYFVSAKGDKATAVKAAQKTSNGTLYQIDKVLLPQ